MVNDENRPHEPGTILVEQYDDAYHPYKILRIDGFGTYHILSYKPTSSRPTATDLDTLEVWVWHAPIADISAGSVVGHRPVTEEELQGYYEYLKRTNFEQYLSETQQDIDAVVQAANEAYRDALRLTDDGDPEGALERYADAVDLFPFFYEALDNRAFVTMDLGRYAAARADFEASLRVAPDNFTAVFSIGECYYHEGAFDTALEWFERAVALAPERAIAHEWRDRALRRIEEDDRIGSQDETTDR